MATEPNSDDRTDATRYALADLRDRPMAPSGLERRVVEALAARGELRRSAGRRAWALRLAAALALFASGVAAGRGGVPRPGGSDPEPAAAYLLLLHGGAPSGGDEAAREIGSWARQLARGGVTLHGAELAEREIVLGPASGGRLGGYFLVEAGSEERAVAIAESCPHLRHGGSIAVRAVVEPAGG